MSLLVLLRTAYAVQAEIEARLAVTGLSLAKLVALETLAYARAPIPLSALAERLSCVKSNITQLVDRLEADGLVRRSADPEDRRAWLAVLTAAGEKARRKGTRIRQQAERELLRALSRQDQRTLAALLQKLRAGRG